MSQADKAKLVERVVRSLDARNLLVNLFARNAAMRHGIPLGESEVAIPIETVERSTNIERNREDRPQAGNLVKLALAALAGAAGVGVPVGLINYFSKDAPAQTDKSGSILQYLEDQGMHVPDGD